MSVDDDDDDDVSGENEDDDIILGAILYIMSGQWLIFVWFAFVYSYFVPV